MKMDDTRTEIYGKNGLETEEVKRPMIYRGVDDSLSEWEAARLVSKTWSVEQE